MTDYKGKWFGERDIKFINSIAADFMGDVMQVTVMLYKICPTETKTNIYGETDQTNGRFYYPGVTLTALIDRADITTEDANFGPDRDQTAVFKIREKMLQLVNFYPQVGDLILFNERYYEMDNVVQEQFIGNQPDKSFSFIIHTHYSRLEKIQIIPRQN